MTVYLRGALARGPDDARTQRRVGAVVLLTTVLAQSAWVVVLAWAVVRLASG